MQAYRDQGCLKHGRLFDWRTGQWMGVDKNQLEALQQIFAHLGAVIDVKPIPCDMCLAEMAGRSCAACRKQITEVRYVVDWPLLYHISCWSGAVDQLAEAQKKVLNALQEIHSLETEKTILEVPTEIQEMH